MEKVARALARHEAGEKLICVEDEHNPPRAQRDPGPPDGMYERVEKPDGFPYTVEITYECDVCEKFWGFKTATLKTWCLGSSEAEAVDRWKNSRFGHLVRYVSHRVTAGNGPRVSQERTFCGTRMMNALREKATFSRERFFMHKGRKSKYF
jgi:hypothetical protein